MLSNDLPSDPHSERQTDERRRIVRDIAIAAGVLLFLGGLVVFCYIFFSKPIPPPAEERSVSTAAWIGTSSADREAKPGASLTAGAEQAAPPEDPAQKYAPSPEELKVAESDQPSSPDSGVALGSIRQGTVQKGMPVITSLTRLGVSMADAHELISALRGIFDFRTAKPGHSFEVRVDEESGKPIYFRYDAALTEVYEVERQSDRLVGRKKYIPTDKTLRQYGGTIASSLYATLAEAGAHPTLSGLIVDVLANEVDFYKAQRPGDTFRVLIEEESIKGTFLDYGPVEALEYNGVKCGKKRFYRFAAGDDVTYYDGRGISVPRSVLSIPLHYTKLSSRFGLRYHPILRRKQLHNGVDFYAPPGTPVWVCRSGQVIYVGNNGPNGNLVIVQHDEGLKSYYAHLQRFVSGLKAGTEVKERQIIGYVGSTGRSTGPHLHFGLKRGGQFVDPLKYKVRPGQRVAPRYRQKLQAVVAERGKLLDQTPIKPPSAPLVEAPEEDEILGIEEL